MADKFDEMATVMVYDLKDFFGYLSDQGYECSASKIIDKEEAVNLIAQAMRDVQRSTAEGCIIEVGAHLLMAADVECQLAANEIRDAIKKRFGLKD